MDKLIGKPLFYKNVVIQIFMDHWARFKEFHPGGVTEEIDENVEKMMGCGLLQNGFLEYRCTTGCGHRHLIAFTCKSRFCLRCGKVYIDKWVKGMRDTIFPWIVHRHVILTVPSSLWEYFHDKTLLDKLAQCGICTIKELLIEASHDQKIEPGILQIIQTSGRASTWNPHLHNLVTEGGLTKDGHWRDIMFFPYNKLRLKWMYNLLNMMREAFPNDEVVKSKLKQIYEERKNKGLIVRAKKESLRQTDIIGYLIKYVASLPIALSRIIKYDGRQVTYWYREHPTNNEVQVKVSAFEFIRRMIQHIMPKGFRLIRHYGLYARNKVSRIRQILTKIFEGVRKFAGELKHLLEKVLIPQNYRERIKESFGEDPLICPYCKQEMPLWGIWHPRYGWIYDFCRDDPGVIENEEKGDVEKDERETQRLPQQECLPQFSLFPV